MKLPNGMARKFPAISYSTYKVLGVATPPHWSDRSSSRDAEVMSKSSPPAVAELHPQVRFKLSIEENNVDDVRMAAGNRQLDRYHHYFPVIIAPISVILSVWS